MQEKQSQKSHSPLQDVEGKIVGSIFGRGSTLQVFNPAIMIVITMCLFCACCVLNHCKVAAIMIGVLGIFTSEI